ncbi:MAG: AMP-binding protein [Nitrospirae bacterium]|nr:AMP-binding protein [Nitrospirota bacterium]
MLLNRFLEQSAERFPGKTALITSKGRYSYGGINEMANRVANALIGEGLERGDRIALFMENSLEAVICMFGILKAGCIFLPVNPTTRTEKLTYILNNCQARAVLSAVEMSGVIANACNNTPSLSQVYLSGKDIPLGLIDRKIFQLDSILLDGNRMQPEPRVIDADLAAIIYTSGSSGFPKGVMMAHFNMVSAANSITTYLENTPDDIILNVLPLSFDYGLYQVIMGFKAGATVILENSYMYPYRIIQTILKERVTGFPIVPTISAILLQMDDIKRHDFSCLRYISNTAAALPVSHIQKLRELFPGTRIYSMYGLTECKRVSYLPPDQLDIRPDSVGKGMPNTEAYIVDENGNRVGPDVIGELVVRGSNIMRGYWGLPEKTAERLKPGPFPGEMVLYTGDLFRMDREGYLYFVSRKDDIIKSRGEKVSPKEVENILYEIEGVAEAAVIGVNDEILGEAVKAVIVLKDGIKLKGKDIIRFCAMHLEDFMVPKVVEFSNGLPKTETGKINKLALKEESEGLAVKL